MYRQTYWGLRALADVALPIAPWSTGPRTIVEVLPAHVARRLPALAAYKTRAAGSLREAALASLRREYGIAVEASAARSIVEDGEGDALDAVLAAVAAAAAFATRFAGAPPDAASSGEGWIYC